MPSRSPLDRELVLLRRLIVTMASRIDEQFADTMNALLRQDVALAEKVIANDDQIDALELKIDQQCERILALHAPVAVDLRMLIMAVKINTDFERIGDHCRNLSRTTEHLVGAADLVAETHMSDMGDMARYMLREVEAAFLDRDRLRARKVIASDLQVNRMHAENFEMLARKCAGGHNQAEAVAHLLTASKSLERISDHAKNIAQSIVFLIEGNDIRHRQNVSAPDATSDPLDVSDDA